MDITVSSLLNKLYDWLTTSGIKILIGLIALSIGLKLIKKVISLLNRVLEKRGVDTTLRSFLDTFVNMALKIILILCVMDYVGLQTSSLTALVASAGLAIGLALQGSLSNFAGGVIILLIRPFNVGDYVEVNDKQGVVERISIFYTYLATIDNKRILIPNGELSNENIVNYTANDTRRVDLTFGVAYNSDLEKVKEVLKAAVERNELILKEPEVFIGIVELSESSIDFAVRAWCNTPDYWPVYNDLMDSITHAFMKENIEIPFPQMDVNLKNKV